MDTAGPASAPAGRLLSANTRLTAGQLIAGALVCSAAGQKGGRGGAWSHACRWPLDRRHRTGLLIPALPLVPAELGEVLPITGPQFPTCKMGRSRHSSAVGLRQARQEVGGGAGQGPQPPGPASPSGPRLPPPPRRRPVDRPVPNGLLAQESSFLLSSLAAAGSLFGDAQGTG